MSLLVLMFEKKDIYKNKKKTVKKGGFKIFLLLFRYAKCPSLESLYLSGVPRG